MQPGGVQAEHAHVLPKPGAGGSRAGGAWSTRLLVFLASFLSLPLLAAGGLLFEMHCLLLDHRDAARVQQDEDLIYQYHYQHLY